MISHRSILDIIAERGVATIGELCRELGDDHCRHIARILGDLLWSGEIVARKSSRSEWDFGSTGAEGYSVH